ncbi:MAG: erythromycin esterase family protein [Methanomicrobiales archaeon]|nr:erythromycin esterase family protein [Methanomicrobiales archaeon]
MVDEPEPDIPYNNLREWVEQEGFRLSPDEESSFHTAIDQIICSCSPYLQVLGLGEPFHGGRDILKFRNRLFFYLVDNYGFRSIAIESSFTRGLMVQEYICDSGKSGYDNILDTGFSHGFGYFPENRELVEWMKAYNNNLSNTEKLRFYGFDAPAEMTMTDSPRLVLIRAIDYLMMVDKQAGQEYLDRIIPLIGDDDAWENPDAMMDPSKSIGLSPTAAALRIAVEELVTDLDIRRPEYVPLTGEEGYTAAHISATLARLLLTYHACIARKAENRIARCLGIRDLMMAEILEYIVRTEENRGKIFAFAHNSHLKCGKSEWNLGKNLLTWWPAGSHLRERIGTGYAVIGSGIGKSQIHGIGDPEPGTIEGELANYPGPITMIPTKNGKSLVSGISRDIPVRSVCQQNPGYFPFTNESINEYDWLVFFPNLIA